MSVPSKIVMTSFLAFSFAVSVQASATVLPPKPYSQYMCDMWKMDSYADDETIEKARKKFPDRWAIKLLVPPTVFPVKDILEIEYEDEVSSSLAGRWTDIEGTRAVIYPYKDDGKTTNSGRLIKFAGSTLSPDIEGNVAFFMISEALGRSRLIVHYNLEMNPPFDSYRQIRAAGNCRETIAFIKSEKK